MLSIRLNKELEQELDLLAKTRGSNRSAVDREALKRRPCRIVVIQRWGLSYIMRDPRSENSRSGSHGWAQTTDL
jgi:predicted transcriptional regulator